MKNRWLSDDRAFGEPLRREARATEPEFSEPLHQEICRAVRRARANRIEAEHTANAARRWPWATVALAGALMLAGIVAWRSDWLDGLRVRVAMPPGPAQSVTPQVAESVEHAPWLPALMDRAATQADSFISKKLVTDQLAYLEHDARVLASAVTGGSLDSFWQPATLENQADPGRLSQ